MEIEISEEKYDEITLKCTVLENVEYTSPEYRIHQNKFKIKFMWQYIHQNFILLKLRFHNSETNNCDVLSVESKELNFSTEVRHQDYWVMLNVPIKLSVESIFYITVCVSIVNMTPPYAAIYDDEELLDFELCGTDGSVKFHKTVLAITIPVLGQMLSNGKWRESKDGKLQVHNTTKQTIQQLKDYIYLGTLPDAGVPELLLLASFYMMKDLEYRCISKLITSLTTSNVCELLKFACLNEIPVLMVQIMKALKFGTIDPDNIVIPSGNTFQSIVDSTTVNKDLPESDSTESD